MRVMKEIFSNPEEKECRVWHNYKLSLYDLLSQLDETIQDAGLYTNQVCVCVHVVTCVRACISSVVRHKSLMFFENLSS